MPDVRKFVTPFPPLEEQRAIVAFVRSRIPVVDSLIKKKGGLIEVLREKRTALITRAVTRGLNPGVETKDSGVEWLGEVPEHWSTTQLQFLTETHRPIMYGIVLPGPNVPEGVPIVKGGDVKPGRLDIERLNRTTFEIESKYARSRLRGGDLVYAIRGSIGEVERVPDSLTGANLTQDAARVSVNDRTDANWLLFALRGGPVFAQLEAGSLGATIRGINIRDLKRVRIPVPPRAEQERIAEYLSRTTLEIAEVFDAIEDAITLLREYRTALISAAVTGKIDVREHTHE
jgi:type I restriction enzyme S subunit